MDTNTTTPVPPAGTPDNTQPGNITAPERYTDYLPIDDIAEATRNAKAHNRDEIVNSIRAFGFADIPVLDERTGRLVGGHGRLEALRWMRDAGEAPPEGIRTDGTTWLAPVLRGWSSRSDADADALAIALNRLTEKGGWHEHALAEILDDLADTDPDLLAAAGYTPEELDDLLASLQDDGDLPDGVSTPEGGLLERFLVPPFSVLDARQGYWRDRKAAWLRLGIQSEKGRPGREEGGGNGEGLLYKSLTAVPDYYDEKRKVEARLGRELTHEEFQRDHFRAEGALKSGTSIFDPVLCEVTYRWFAPPGGSVLDPFAGGSVRGIVAARLGLNYTGVELRPEQVESNREQAEQITPDNPPTWHIGDSRALLRDPARPLGDGYDLVFSCPPYADLEVYSDDPADLSNMTYDEFRQAHADIIAAAVDALADDRFAVWVISDVRDKRTGFYRGLVGDTIAAFERAGARFYNDAILFTTAGSLPVRAGRQFEHARKLGRTHQNVLVFVKGDPRAAVQACGPVDVSDAIAHFTAEHDSDSDGDGDGGEGEGGPPPEPPPDYTPDITPVEEHGGVLVKRDDAWTRGGASGAKARAMFTAAQAIGAEGIVSAGARISPQLERAALVAHALGIPCRLHTGAGRDTPETATAARAGAEILRHRPGRLNVIKARFREDAARLAAAGWLVIPYGMEHDTYLEEVAHQAAHLPRTGYARIVVPTGSGMTLAGVLRGLDQADNPVPVLGVLVGGDPTERLDRYAPGWRSRVETVTSRLPYERHAPNRLGDLILDPVYEAKCLPYLREGDLLWAVGIRASALPTRP